MGLSKWWRPGPNHFTAESPGSGGAGSGGRAETTSAPWRGRGSTETVKGGVAVNSSACAPSMRGAMPRESGRMRVAERSDSLSTRTVTSPSASKSAAQ